MLTTQKQSKPSPRKIALFAAIVFAVILAGYFGIAYVSGSMWPFASTTPEVDSQETSDINYQPSTEQEVEDSQNAKKNNSHQDDSSSDTPKNDTPSDTSSQNTVSVGIAFAGYDKEEKAIDVRAFTPDVIEGDGTCTATFTKDGKTITHSAKAFIDSSTSQCNPILIPGSEFTSTGVWNLVVTYTSSNHTGTSSIIAVDIPS